MVVTLCMVAWRGSKIESLAVEAKAAAASAVVDQDKMKEYLSSRRDISDERWSRVISELAGLRGEVSALRDTIRRNSH